jgi:hypothetical protein
MDKHEAQAGDKVDAEQVRRCVSELKESPQFNRAPDLCRFLDHIVESALSGQHGELKGSVLANKLFSDRQDPDGTVRTMASRLRDKLKEYYESGGQRQRYRINLPPGSYIPTFELVEPSTSDELLNPTTPGSIKPAWKIAVSFIAGLILGLVIGVIVERRTPKQGPQESAQAVLVSESQGFHIIDIDKNTGITMVQYGTVVRGRTVVKDDEQLYLLVLDSSGLKYYPQPDHEGNAPLKLCPDGSWARQVWPGTPNVGDHDFFDLVVIKTNQQLPKEFLKQYLQDLPNGSELKRLRVRRVPAIVPGTYIFKCG